MASVPFKKIRLLITRNAVNSVLETVQKLGVVEFRTYSSDLLREEQQTDFDANYKANQVSFAISFLEKFEYKNIFARVFEGLCVHSSETEIINTAHTLDYEKIVKTVHNIESSLNEVKTEKERLGEEALILLDWQDSSINLSNPLSTRKTTTLPLRIPQESIDLFKKDLELSNVTYSLKRAGQESYLLTFFKENEKDVEVITHRYQLEQVELPEYSGTPTSALTDIKEKIIDLEEKERDLTDKAVEMTKNLPDLRKIAGYFSWKQHRQSMLYSHGKATDSVFVFEGWCPESQIDHVYHGIDKITHDFHLEELDPKEDEDPPVEIRNRRTVWPFESVTRLYGVPSSKDIDPSPFVAVFFFIFFGLCLTDVGYGLFLMIVTGMILILYRVQKNLKQLLVLLLLGGTSSFLAGLLFGGYFGVDMSVMPQWLQNLQYFDPINNPLPFFYLTLVLGFIQVIVGLALDIARQTKFTTMRDGFMDNGPWLLLFTGIALYVSGLVDIIQSSPLYVWTIVLSCILIVLSSGRKEKGVLTKGFKGVLGLYDFINYFSDVLSYSRLLALGLATSALAFSVNLIALLLNDMVPSIIAPVVMVIVLVVGHTFNLVINTLGAYIHTARLQFVEFFGKFLVSTGKPFQPFQRDDSYVILTKKTD